MNSTNNKSGHSIFPRNEVWRRELMLQLVTSCT